MLATPILQPYLQKKELSDWVGISCGPLCNVLYALFPGEVLEMLMHEGVELAEFEDVTFSSP